MFRSKDEPKNSFPFSFPLTLPSPRWGEETWRSYSSAVAKAHLKAIGRRALGGGALVIRPRREVRGLLAAVLLLSATGCLQDMADQPKIEPLEQSPFYDRGTSARKPVPGTVARGQLRTDKHYFTGKIDGEPAATFPQRFLEGKTSEEILERGQQRYAAFCSHCHGMVGGGRGGGELEDMVGMVVKRGFPKPPSYHIDRLREAPPGHFFDVITNGIGRMAAHDYLVPVDDRWAITAYIRALQLSQHAPADLLEQTDLDELPGD